MLNQIESPFNPALPDPPARDIVAQANRSTLPPITSVDIAMKRRRFLEGIIAYYESKLCTIESRIFDNMSKKTHGYAHMCKRRAAIRVLESKVPPIEAGLSRARQELAHVVNAETAFH